MVYHYEISRNRRLLLLPLFTAILLTASLLTAVLWKPIIGLLSFLVIALFGYQIIKIFRNQVKSVIHITDEGVHGLSCDGSKFSFQWDNLSLAGEFSNPGDLQEIFLYSDKDDFLLRIPCLYSQTEEMILEIEEQVSEFVRWEGSVRGDLETRLKDRFAANGE